MALLLLTHTCIELLQHVVGTEKLEEMSPERKRWIVALIDRMPGIQRLEMFAAIFAANPTNDRLDYCYGKYCAGHWARHAKYAVYNIV